jgi:hypothetical protein
MGCRRRGAGEERGAQESVCSKLLLVYNQPGLAEFLYKAVVRIYGKRTPRSSTAIGLSKMSMWKVVEGEQQVGRGWQKREVWKFASRCAFQRTRCTRLQSSPIDTKHCIDVKEHIS